MAQQTRRTIDTVLEDWPGYSTETATTLMGKYGEPDEVTRQRMVWHDNGPWKRTILHREGPRHEFPIPHRDYLEQYLDYEVPPEKFDDLAEYDGSVHADRTRGELGASCHEEGANVLALNLAHEVVTDQKTIEEARDAYAATMAKGKAGGSPAYMQDLQFDVPEGGTGDPDVTIATDKVTRNLRTVGLAGLALVAVLFYATRRRRGARQGQQGEQGTQQRIPQYLQKQHQEQRPDHRGQPGTRT